MRFLCLALLRTLLVTDEGAAFQLRFLRLVLSFELLQLCQNRSNTLKSRRNRSEPVKTTHRIVQTHYLCTAFFRTLLAMFVRPPRVEYAAVDVLLNEVFKATKLRITHYKLKHNKIQHIMSKITLEAPFLSIRGKVCKHAKIIFKQVRHTAYTSQVCNPRTSACSENEEAARTKFKNAVAASVAALADSTQRAQYEVAFKKQSRYQTLRGFVIAQEYAKL